MHRPRSRYAWLLTLVRTLLCVGALAYLFWTVNWYDYAVLPAPQGEKHGPRLRLLDEHGATLSVRRDGMTETIPREQVDHIEYGIASVVWRVKALQALLATLILAPVPLLQSWRLVWMLAIQGVRLTLWNSIKLSYAGNFFNFALPGTTGGDLIKAYYLTRFTSLKTEAVTTVFLDRAIGLFGLVVLAGVMIAVAWDPQQFGHLALVLVLILVGLALGALVVFSRRLRRALRLSELAARLPLGEQIIRIGRATVAMRQHKLLVLAALLITIVLQFVVMVSAFVMARALGMSGDFFRHYLIYVPIGFLVAAIPIAPPQGVGVVEAFYIFAFARVGTNSDAQAVTLAVAVRLMQLIWAIPGVLVPLLGAHLPSGRDLEALEAESAETPSAQPAGANDCGALPTTGSEP